MKKVLCFLMTALMIVLLAGCGETDNQTPTATESNLSAQETQPVQTEPEDDNYSATEPQTLTSTDAIDNDNNENEFEEETESYSYKNSDSTVDWTTRTYNCTDTDGYTYQITIKLSPWIFTGNTSTLNAAWGEVGKGNPLPTTFKDWGLKQVEKYQDRQNVGVYAHDESFLVVMTDMYYSVGQIYIKNVTEGWNITSSSPRNPIFEIYTNVDVASMASTITRTFYGNKTQDQANKVRIDTKMTGDTWGPVPFIMMAPENISPNYPDGEYFESILNSDVSVNGWYISHDTTPDNQFNIGIIDKQGVYHISESE
ncbi:MAG: hypothetical protein IJH32_10300 [Ruminococcus sp.]|nr:hypothetical protein [Ruminococcus sp.]